MALSGRPTRSRRSEQVPAAVWCPIDLMLGLRAGRERTMTPQQVTKLRRVEVMRARLKKPRDPHIAQMQAHQLMLDCHMMAMERLGRRQADALEALRDAAKELRA